MQAIRSKQLPQKPSLRSPEKAWIWNTICTKCWEYSPEARISVCQIIEKFPSALKNQGLVDHEILDHETPITSLKEIFDRRLPNRLKRSERSVRCLKCHTESSENWVLDENDNICLCECHSLLQFPDKSLPSTFRY